jgi:hypothetical protein
MWIQSHRQLWDARLDEPDPLVGELKGQGELLESAINMA